MALELTSLYVETPGGDLERLADLLGPVFAQQCEEVGLGPLALRLVAADGWVAVLGAQALEGRAIVAEGLSRELSLRAVTVELLGAAFRFRVERFDRGRALPGAAFGPSVGPDDPMPLYPEAEGEALRALVAAGVPGRLALFCPEAVGTVEGPQRCLDLRWDGGAFGRVAGEVRPVRSPPGEAPVVFGRLDGSAVRARRLGLEPRAVAGRASIEALRRLLELEGIVRRRAQAVAPDVDVRFFYRRAGGEPLDPVAELDRKDHPSALGRFLGRRG